MLTASHDQQNRGLPWERCGRLDSNTGVDAQPTYIPILIVAFLKVPVSNLSLIPKEELPTRNRLIADIS